MEELLLQYKKRCQRLYWCKWKSVIEHIKEDNYVEFEHYLDNAMMNIEQKVMPASSTFQQYCRINLPFERHGALELRSRIWPMLLGIDTIHHDDKDNMKVQTEASIEVQLECQSIVDEWEKRRVIISKQSMETILVLFLQEKSVDYCKGMAILAAPFLIAGPLSLPLDTISECVYKLCATFMPHLIAGMEWNEEDAAIKQQQQLILHLLLYHAPSVGHYLNTKEPNWEETIPTFAFMPLAVNFGKKEKPNPECLLILWDYFLVLEDTHFSLFLIVAILICALEKQSTGDEEEEGMHWKDCFNAPFTDIPVTKCIATTAFRLYTQTPTFYDAQCLRPSRTDTLHQAFQSSSDEKTTDFTNWKRHESRTYQGKFYWRDINTGISQWEHPRGETDPMPVLLCLPSSIDEVTSDRKDRKYFIVDIRAYRSSEDYKSGTIPSAYSLDPSIFTDPDRMQSTFTALQSLRGAVHIVLMGHGIGIPSSVSQSKELKSAIREAVRMDYASLNTAILFFQKHLFQQVSYLQGGFAAWHAYVRDDSSMKIDELVGHDTEQCKFCRCDASLEESTTGGRDHVGALQSIFGLRNWGTTATSILFPREIHERPSFDKDLDGISSPSSDNSQVPSPSHSLSSSDEELEIELPTFKISIGAPTKLNRLV